MQWMLCCIAGTQSHNEQHEAGTAVTTQMAISLHCSFSLLLSAPIQVLYRLQPLQKHLHGAPTPLTLALPVSHLFLFSSLCFCPFLNSERHPQLGCWLSFSLQRPVQVQTAPDLLPQRPNATKTNKRS